MSKLLVEYGANVNFQNNVKDTPLHLAVQSGKFSNQQSFLFRMPYKDFEII